MGESLSKWQQEQPPPGISQSTHLSARFMNAPNPPLNVSRRLRKPLHTNRIQQTNVPYTDIRPSSAPPLLTTSTDNDVRWDETVEDYSLGATLSPAHSGFSDQHISFVHPRSKLSSRNFHSARSPHKHKSAIYRHKRGPALKHPSGIYSMRKDLHRHNYYSNMMPSRSKNSHYSSVPLDLSLPKTKQPNEAYGKGQGSKKDSVYMVAKNADIMAEHSTIWSSGGLPGQSLVEHHHEIPAPPPLQSVNSHPPSQWHSARPTTGPRMTIHHQRHSSSISSRFTESLPMIYHHGKTLASSTPLNSSSLPDQPLALTATSPPYLSAPTFPITVIDDDDDDDDEEIYVSYPPLSGAAKKRRTSKFYVAYTKLDKS